MATPHLIVIYDHLLATGGVPYETRALIGGLVANGATVTAVCNSRRPSPAASPSAVIADFENADDYTPPRVVDYGLRSLATLLRSEDCLQTVFLLIGCRRAEYLVYATMIRSCGFRFVVFPHGLLAPERLDSGWNGRKKGWLRRRVERAFQFAVDRPVLRCAAMARALSASEAVRLKSLGATRVFEIADGVDSSWLAASKHAVPAPQDRIVLLYLGRPEPFQKGLDILLRAVDALARPDAVELVLAGPDKDRFHRVVLEVLGRFPDWVRLAGMVTGKAKWQVMADAHLLAHVSRFEGMAKCAREAVGRGLPVLASYESNFGDWVQATGAGLATYATVEAVRDTVLHATLLTPDEWAAMRDAARRFATEHSWHKVATRILSQIESDTLVPAPP